MGRGANQGDGGQSVPARGAGVSRDDDAARIDFLIVEIKRHKDLYYNGQSEITDAEFDGLEHELAQLQAAHPDLVDENPLAQVGAKTSGQFEEIQHDTPMLSLNKVNTEADLIKFLEKFPGESFTAVNKFDGVSLSITYEKGKLIRAATRGDGVIGELITDNAKRIKGVRHTLEQAVDCEIRGEVLMMRSDWKAYNAANPDKPFANPRNAVSGSMRLKDPEEVAKRPMTFVAYDIIIEESDLPEETMPEQLQALGFQPKSYQLVTNPQEAIDYFRNYEKERANLDYEIDGVVFKVADIETFEQAGATSSYPRAAMAVKFTAEVGETVIESVTWQVGKSGIIAPVAEVSPVFLAGTTIKRASLHNLEIIAERGVKVGDRIEIKRAGDVIPHVLGVADADSRTGTEQDISAPTECPSCGSAVEVDSSGVVRCLNVASCPAQVHRRMIHWGSRGAADIDALGESWLEKFADAGLVKQTSDIYRLSRDDFFDASDNPKFEGMGERLSTKLLNSIDESKNVGLRRALIGMSIPFASEGTAKRLCRAGYDNIEGVAAAGPEKLAEIDDIGPVVAESIDTFLNRPETQTEIKALRELGVNLDTLPEDGPVKVAAGSSPLAGKTVVITGALDGISRKEMQAKVEALGGKASSSVSKNTDYVIAGDKAGSKKAKAEELGVAILDQAAAEALMA